MGGWLVYPSLGRMIRGEETVALRRRVMHVLVCLASRPGEVVTREELLQTVWHSLVVSEEGLTVAISELRRLFSDAARAPRYIETIRKTGYRALAPIDFEIEAPGGPPLHRLAGTVRSARPTPRRAPTTAWMTPIVFALVAIAGIALLRTYRTADSRVPVVALAGVPLTTDPGSEIHPALSPDGTRVAYGWNRLGEENLDLYVKQVGTGSILQLTDDPAHEMHPAWSPDGTRIAFVRMGERVSLYTVSSIGGPPRLLVRVDAPIEGLDWSPREDVLAFSMAPRPGEEPQIHLLSLETLDVQLLPTGGAESRYAVAPSFSPDGGTIAFIGADGAHMQDIFLVPVSGGEPRRLTHAQRRVDHLDWAPDGRSIVFSAAPRGKLDLWRIGVLDGHLTCLTTPSGGATHPSLAVSRPALVYEELTLDHDIWSVELATTSDSVDRLGPRISSTRGEYEADYAPDGARIVFVSDRSGARELWIAQRDGSRPRQLTEMGGPYLTRPRWSPDGATIAFCAMPDGRAGVYLIAVDGGPPRRLGDETRPALVADWSRDGAWLYLDCQCGDRWEIWRVRPDGSEAAPVVRDGHTFLCESPDGEGWMHYLHGEAGIWETRTGADSPRCVVRADLARGWSAVVVCSRGVYFTRPDSAGTLMGFYDTADGACDTLAVVPCTGGRSLSLAPDGAEVLLEGYQRVGSDLILVEAFH